MKKIEVKRATLSDKLYFHKDDLLNCDANDVRIKFLHQYQEDFFTCLQETSDGLFSVPSHSTFLFDIGQITDERIWHIISNKLTFSAILREEQQEVVDAFFKSGEISPGLLQAPCSWGKTFTGCSMIAKANVSALVIVHTKLLFRQWQRELQNLIPGVPIGVVGDSEFNIKPITVGIYKSLNNNLDKLRDTFSLVLVDECHLCPAEVFSETLNCFNARIKIGISATPRRKDGKHEFLKYYFSPFIVKARDTRKTKKPRVILRKVDIPFLVRDPKRDWTKALTALCNNSEFHKVIIRDAENLVSRGRCILILGERVDMLKQLNQLIPKSALLIGETSEEQRNDVLNNAGIKYDVILSTKLFDEGISCHRLDTLFLTCPSNNPIKLEQRIGRIEREHPDKLDPLVVDYWFRGPVVSRQQTKRQEWYILNKMEIK